MDKFEPIGSIDFTKKIHIYGAGIAGLLIGYYLKKRNADFVIYEKTSKVGGKIQTLQTEFGIAETAANAIYSSDTILEITKELDIPIIRPQQKLMKKIWINGKAKHKLICPFQLIKIIWRSLKKIKLNKEFNSCTVKDFFMPLLGEKFINNIVSPALRGIYAIEADELHAASIFPTPRNKQRYLFYFINIMRNRKKLSNTKAESISFKNGMSDFIGKLSTHLKDFIVVNYDEPLKENSIICTAAHEAMHLMNDKSIGQLLNQISYSHVWTTTVFTKKEMAELRDSFGLLFPSSSGYKTMGILANHNIFPDRTLKDETYSYTIISQPEIEIESELKVIDHDLKIIYQAQTKWPQAIPKYNLNRFLAIQKIKDEIKKFNNILLFGNYTNAISIREMAEFAKILAN